ncbi:MAG: acyl-CoA dehydrogenase family protein [Nocardioides sp.]|uniref:acyl-CoA dehydrogenase family protein n=1 Tax=Nocardioides sp. TaxID=35761 RepID=UPI0039E35C01
MDFRLDEDHQALSDLAAAIFADLSQPTRLREVEAEGGFDTTLWRALAEADLLGIGLPEAAGGAGMGLIGVAALLEQQGRRTALVPLWSVLTTALTPIAEFGSAEQREQWLPRILRGDDRVVGAFTLEQDGVLPFSGTPDGEGWVLSGELPAVLAAPHAAAFVLPFRVEGRPYVALLPRESAGVEVTPTKVTSRESAGNLRLDGVRVRPADLLDETGGTDGAAILARVRTVATIGQAALAVGVCSEAVAMAAAYTSQRVQFGRPLSTNQGISLRLADAHLDTERTRLTTYHAAWQVDEGRGPERTWPAALVCSWWAKEAGTRVVHSTQHVHGGIGGDVDYPIHRYLIWGKQIALTAGSAASTQAELGSVIETAPRIGAALEGAR